MPTVGLPKKGEENGLEEYKSLGNMELIGSYPGGSADGVSQVMHYHIEQMRKHPEHFFNFGFTYSDFKSYLLKITYCRAVRKFVEQKRIQRIEEFQKNNENYFEIAAENQENVIQQ